MSDDAGARGTEPPEPPQGPAPGAAPPRRDRTGPPHGEDSGAFVGADMPGAFSGEGDDEPAPQERRRRLEGLLREAVRKAVEKGVEAGVGTLNKADKTFRDVVDDVPLPKELVGYLFSSIDDTKNAVVRGVAGEVRDFLDATDVAGELQRALTSLSFEIKTEVRFIPNDAGGVKPQVRARAVPKRAPGAGTPQHEPPAEG
ncbi:MAG: hypothetical protein AAF447_22275 [Myxococcota bacterium]